MPKGTPKDWTLDELSVIWDFDGSDGAGGTITVTEAARRLGITHSHWYGVRARLQAAGGPEQLYEEMQEAKQHRYNRASNGRVRQSYKSPDTLKGALSRIYQIRISSAGRGGGYEQFSVTIPPILADAFIAQHGSIDICYEPREDGILIKPVPRVDPPPVPGWLKAKESEPAA